MSKWSEKKEKECYDTYLNDIVEISKMVEDGKLSSNGGKQVFNKVYRKYHNNLHYIREIDELFSDDDDLDIDEAVLGKQIKVAQAILEED